MGLRLSRRAAAQLNEKEELSFRRWLEAQDCFVPTINGFPFGSFHRRRIKEKVYLPDWRSRARAEYTIRLATLLASWLPAGITGSISTVPLAFKGASADVRDPAIVKNLETVLAVLAQVKEKQGRTILLALEPEPGCLLETTEEVSGFFEGLRLPAVFRDHLGICFDCCHFAVEFEDLAESFARLSAAGIPIAKVQISSSLRFFEGEVKKLFDLNEPCYLHQVVVRSESGRLLRFADIPEALSRRKPQPGDEWRCHFHVPIHHAAFGEIQTTRDALQPILPLIPKEMLLEVETYTWNVLPQGDRGDSVTTSIIRELEWLTEHLHA